MRSKLPAVTLFSENSYSISDLIISKEPKVVVWLTWAVMLLFAIICLFLYGRNVPLAEDWLMVSPLTGNETSFGEWLWQQNNEHRIPLPKLIYLFLLKITNGDFRSGMVLNVFSLGLLAALLIKVFNQIRGGITDYTDAFFPILLLHIGNWPNLFWSWQFTFVLPTILTCLLILIITKYSNALSFRSAILASVCLISLPLCGANGLIYLIPGMAWLSYEGYLHFRNRQGSGSKKIAVILFSAVLVALMIVGAYFLEFERPWWNPPSPGLAATLITGAKFMAMSLGPSVSLSWLLSSLIILLLVFTTFGLLSYAIFKIKGLEFQRTFGLFLFMGASIVFGLAMGWGRAGWVPTLGMPIRYVILAVPTLIICYSAWELYGLPFLRRLVKWGLLISMLFLLLENTQMGFEWRNYYLQGANAVIRDIKQGVPHSVLVERHQRFLIHWDKELLSTGMQQLKNAGMGPFKEMKADTIPK